MAAKSAEDIEGIEYDWLARDEDGHVAMFSTAGAGYAPPTFLRDTDAHDAAFDALLALPATTSAKFFPEIAPGLKNTWKLVAERGLFAFDCDPNGGPYRLVAAPTVAVHADSLPPAVSKVAARVSLRTCLGDSTTIDAEFLALQ